MQQTSVQKENDLHNKKGVNIMLKQMKKRIKNEKGLTLIELLAVIVILAIVAAIAVPAIGNIINNSEIKATKADALNILNAANIFVTDNPTITTITYDGSDFTNAPTTVTEDFANSIQSLGSFSNEGFTITNTSGRLSISTTDNISAGGTTIDFNSATIDTIDAGSAEDDGTSTAGVTVGNTHS